MLLSTDGLHLLQNQCSYLLTVYYNLMLVTGDGQLLSLTLLIKLVLYPLSYKGMVSMQKLKELAPKMKEIQTKYKDDKQKQSMHMMELYKKNGANPMGGCLPLVLTNSCILCNL